MHPRNSLIKLLIFFGTLLGVLATGAPEEGYYLFCVGKEFEVHTFDGQTSTLLFRFTPPSGIAERHVALIDAYTLQLVYLDFRNFLHTVNANGTDEKIDYLDRQIALTHSGTDRLLSINENGVLNRITRDPTTGQCKILPLAALLDPVPKNIVKIFELSPQKIAVLTDSEVLVYDWSVYPAAELLRKSVAEGQDVLGDADEVWVSRTNHRITGRVTSPGASIDTHFLDPQGVGHSHFFSGEVELLERQAPDTLEFRNDDAVVTLAAYNFTPRPKVFVGHPRFQGQFWKIRTALPLSRGKYMITEDEGPLLVDANGTETVMLIPTSKERLWAMAEGAWKGPGTLPNRLPRWQVERLINSSDLVSLIQHQVREGKLPLAGFKLYGFDFRSSLYTPSDKQEEIDFQAFLNWVAESFQSSSDLDDCLKALIGRP